MSEDIISRKAAIDAIMDADVCVTWNGVISDDDAVDIAIKSTKGSVISSIVNMPSAQPETHDKRTKTHSCDCISRQAAMEEISKQQTYKMFEGEDTLYLDANDVGSVLASLPSAQPEQTNSWCINSWCIDCKEYDTEKHSCPRFNRVIKQTIDEIYSHAETEAEARFHAEIVRCKECRHRDPEDHKCDCGHDIIWQLPRDDKWYCADAERRTDDR